MKIPNPSKTMNWKNSYTQRITENNEHRNCKIQIELIVNRVKQME